MSGETVGVGQMHSMKMKMTDEARDTAALVLKTGASDFKQVGRPADTYGTRRQLGHLISSFVPSPDE